MRQLRARVPDQGRDREFPAAEPSGVARGLGSEKEREDKGRALERGVGEELERGVRRAREWWSLGSWC